MMEEYEAMQKVDWWWIGRGLEEEMKMDRTSSEPCDVTEWTLRMTPAKVVDPANRPQNRRL